MTWTDPKTWSVGEVVTAANMNLHLRDNLNATLHLMVRKPADESVTSSITMQNDDHLILPVGANEAWDFQFRLRFTGSNAGHLQIQLTFPTGGDVSAVVVHRNAGGTTVYQPVIGTTSPTTQASFGIPNTGELHLGLINGVITNGGTAGNLTLQWCQNTSNATATTVKANSTLWAVKLA